MRVSYEQEVEVTTHLARSLGVPFVDLRQYSISPGILRKLPCALARKYRCVPMVYNHRRIVLVHDNPADGLRLVCDPTCIDLRRSRDREHEEERVRTVEFALTTTTALDETLRRRSSLPDRSPPPARGR